MPLEVLLDFLGGPQVDFLKVDAQGMDLAVLLSAGRHLPRIQSVREAQLETVRIISREA